MRLQHYFSTIDLAVAAGGGHTSLTRDHIAGGIRGRARNVGRNLAGQLIAHGEGDHVGAVACHALDDFLTVLVFQQHQQR